MNPCFVNPRRPVSSVRGRERAVLALGVLAAAASLAACKGHAPTGQVVAVVNGQEITGQDLAAEARASGAQTRQQAMQRVVSRVLLAQSAHAKGLDNYPGYPSEVARLQQDLLAQKALKAVVKPPAKPTPAAVAAFISAHPYMFKDRVRLQADEIKFQSADDMKSLADAANVASVAERLQSLNIPFARQTRTLDTAELPEPLAEKFLSVPADHIFFVRQGDVVLAIQILSRQPVAVPADQQAAAAAQVMTRVDEKQQVDAELKRLQSRAKITYQNGFGPTPGKPAVTPPPPHG